MIPDDDLEIAACTPLPITLGAFNPQYEIPYGCTVEHIQQAMEEFLDFLGYINKQLNERQLDRLETMLMPANFSSLVGEFMHAAIARNCPTLTRNQYHNGHPDLLPINTYEDDSVLHGAAGIEVKASRYSSGWQGHNAEDVWLLVFVFDSNSQRDKARGIPPRSFRFVSVLGAQLLKDDWSESGRSATSRRTPTASVRRSGHSKMMQNWIYREAALFQRQ
jgi:hypothetical protein